MIRPKRRLALLALAALPVPFLVGLRPLPADDKEPAVFDPTDRYAVRKIEGWTVLVNQGLLAAQPDLAERTLTLLRFQLYQVVRRLPPKAVETLRTIRIWVEEDEPHNPCMTYHPDAGWLRDHGMNPEKAGCVEVSNARTFLEWTLAQPWMLLHELSHGYHHQSLPGGFNNDEIQAAYEHAQAARRYDRVLYFNGQEKKAYAATNPKEYFAESTESYFGTNDFYPFVRSELGRHDPEMFELLRKVWASP